MLPEYGKDGKFHPTNTNNTAHAEIEDQSSAGLQSLDELTPAQLIKATVSYRALVESDGFTLRQIGKRWGCRCPFHNERTPSFFVNEDDDYARCYGCNWHGNVFDYVMARTDCSFGVAFHHLKDDPTLKGTPTKRSASNKIAGPKYRLTDDNLSAIARYTSRVIAEEWLAEKIAQSRNWKTSTIRKLARSGHLGWAGDALAFIYQSGVKIRRWPGREFRWECGEPGLWRAELLEDAGEIYITEGETDAISLIDAGVENQRGSVVVALPSASTYRDEWTRLFQDKVVTICLDGDDAGQNAAAKAMAALSVVARQVFTFNPKEVR